MGNYCGNCGAKLDENASSCKKCGFPVNASKELKGKTAVSGEKNTRQKSFSGKILIGVCVVLILILGVTIITSMTGEEKEKTALELEEKSILNDEYWLKENCEESNVGYADAVKLYFRKDGVVEYTNYRLDGAGDFAEERICGKTNYEKYEDKVIFKEISLDEKEEPHKITMELTTENNKVSLNTVEGKKTTITEKMLSGTYFIYTNQKYEKDVMRELQIPEKVQGSFTIGEPEYWSAGGTWNSFWEYFVSDEDTNRAMCTINCANGEMISDIGIYSEPQDEPNTEEQEEKEPPTVTNSKQAAPNYHNNKKTQSQKKPVKQPQEQTEIPDESMPDESMPEPPGEVIPDEILAPSESWWD